MKKGYGRKNIFFLVVTLVLIIFYWYSLPTPLFNRPNSSVVESNDGTLLSARTAIDGQWRMALTDSVPYKFKMSIITFEDKRFFYHLGVDILALGRAIVQNVHKNAVVSGASTLSMQTIRLSRQGNRTIIEKIIEMVLASQLELRYSKEEILRLYASHAPFGGNVVGLNSAAWRYFGRSAEQLSWAESAMLAVLPNSPSLIRLDRNRELLRTKRDALLDRLCTETIIDSSECELAKAEPLPDKPHPLPMLAAHILNKTGDRTLRTTIDYPLQQRVLSITERHNKLFRTNKVENMAVLVTEVHTGRVMAYVGNTYCPTDTRNGSNVDVIMSQRSSGSALKPFLFAAMMDDGSALPTMLFPDVPLYYKNFSPQNFNRTFDGAVAANRVLERSLNIPSVMMLEKYGTEKFLALLQKIGFSTLTNSADHYGLSLILGGGDIRMWDLTRAYTLMAAKLNGQKEINDISYNIDNHKTIKSDDIPLSKAALWLTLNSITNVNRPEEEGDWKYFESSRKIGWKTGTSYGNRDAWAIGVTPQYVVCVWVGNSSGEGRPQMTGVSYAAPVLFDVFSTLPKTDWFSAPEIELEPVAVCSQSGHPASPICEKRDTLMLPSVSRQAAVCPYHQLVNLSIDRRYMVNAECYDVHKIRTESMFILPAVWEWYYRKKNADYTPLPPLHPEMRGGESSQNRLDILYPRNGHTIVITRGIDSKLQQIIFSAAHNDPSATLFWHLDDQYIGTTQGEHKISHLPSPGTHTLTILDKHGARCSIFFILKN